MVLRTFSGSYRGCHPAGCILVSPHASHTFARLVNDGISCVRHENKALETEFAPAKFPKCEPSPPPYDRWLTPASERKSRPHSNIDPILNASGMGAKSRRFQETDHNRRASRVTSGPGRDDEMCRGCIHSSSFRGGRLEAQ